MALTTTTFSVALPYKLTVNTDTDTGVSNGGYANVTGTTGTLYGVEIDNSGVGQITYVKFYDATSVAMGTDRNLLGFRVDASSRLNIFIPGGIAFSAGITMGATNHADGAGTAGTTDPSSAVTVRLITS